MGWFLSREAASEPNMRLNLTSAAKELILSASLSRGERVFIQVPSFDSAEVCMRRAAAGESAYSYIVN